MNNGAGGKVIHIGVSHTDAETWSWGTIKTNAGQSSSTKVTLENNSLQ